MANQGGTNGTSNEASYSSPVPVIGYYIAGVSLLCLVLMLCDVVAARRRGKFWIPCKFFTLNSVMLSLLSIATKLPVDLTTPMPGPHDQLSKLCGTTFICVSIAFLMPSLAINKKSERLSNVAALTIFIVTVAVNVCIQMSTRVIMPSFVVEHSIVLCCMMLYVPIMWQIALYTEGRTVLHDKSVRNKLEGRHGHYPDNRSMLERLMRTYVHECTQNPELEVSKHPSYTAMAGLCIICSSVLIQALVRHLRLEAFKSYATNCDYGWSIWLVVLSQTLVVIIGSFGTCFRVYIQTTNVKLVDLQISHISKVLQGFNPIMGLDIKDTSRWILLMFSEAVVIMVFILIRPTLWLVFGLLRRMVSKILKHGYEEDATEAMVLVDGQPKRFDGKDGFLEGQSDRWFVESMQERCMMNMKTWMGNGSLKNLKQVLSRTMPSESEKCHAWKTSAQSAFLYLVLLVKIAKLSTPTTLSACLENAFRDAYEYIDFVDTQMKSRGYLDKPTGKIARSLWNGRDFDILLPRDFQAGRCAFQSDLDRAHEVIKEVYNVFRKDGGSTHTIMIYMDTIIKSINTKTYSSVEDLYYHMEQLFVDTVHVCLVQVPNEIFKDVHGSSVGKCEVKLERALKLLGKLGYLEDQVKWLIPEGLHHSRVTAPVYFISKSQYCKVREGIAHFQIAPDGSECMVVANVTRTPLDDATV